jgi:hypothetical protein
MFLRQRYLEDVPIKWGRFRSMRVLVCASGTIGDLHPLVAIAAAMRRRGHEVYLLANSVYESLAAEANVDFEPVGTREEHETVSSHPQLWTYARGWKLWIRGGGIAPMRKLYSSIEKLARPNETIVVAAYLCLGGPCRSRKTATSHSHSSSERSYDSNRSWRLRLSASLVSS